MPDPKRQSLTNRKRMTDRQIVLARRSRSIKASLLKVLSLDLVTLYQAEPAKDSDNTIARNPSQPMPGQASDFYSPSELHESHHAIPPTLESSIRSVNRSDLTESRQVQNMSNLDDSQAVSRSANHTSSVTVLARCCALLVGFLIRCVLILYVQPFAVLLSGAAITLSGISVLMVVMFTPWKKKLLWNLGCLFGGLLIAVFVV